MIPALTPPAGAERPRRVLLLLLLSACLSPALSLVAAPQPPDPEEVFFPIPGNLVSGEQPDPTPELQARPGYAEADTDDVMTLHAFVYKPENAQDDEELPVVILLHGSSGLYSYSDMANGVSYQYREWAEELTDRGYLVILPESFHVRGIAGSFKNREPHYLPDEDDSRCSPNYERPKDVVATLAYLAGRDDVDPDKIGILAFSQGAQTALNAILDPEIDLSPYSEDYTDSDGETTHEVDSPVRIPDDLPFPKIVAAYYPGCGFFSYHGSPNDPGAGRYMPDARTRVVMFHGTEDSLMDDLFPVTLVDASRAHAEENGHFDPFIHHYLFNGADHSFDKYSVKIEPEANWGTEAEDDDEAAKRIARRQTLKLFAWKLQDVPLPIVTRFTGPWGTVLAPGQGGGGRGKEKSDLLEVSWTGEPGLAYRVTWSPDGERWDAISGELEETGRGLRLLLDRSYFERGEVALEVLPGRVPWADPRNLEAIRFPHELRPARSGRE